ncbi:HU family DNA-binding protein [Floccifex sp.]|uniref:HU family DNA-binding protein n=1 Tax=Floccifex sp. TaxID=2815810 RepID=UPI003F09E695
MAKYVNKASLAQALMDSFPLNKTEANKMVDIIFNEMSSCLEQGGKVDITSFGKFELFEQVQRNGINPKTKNQMVIPKQFIPKFRCSSTLKKKCNSKSS